MKRRSALILCYLWGMFWVALGILLIAALWTAPLGLVCLGVAGYPLYKWHKRDVHLQLAKREQEGAVTNDDYGTYDPYGNRLI